MTTKHRIFTTSFASVYPHYVAKAEERGVKKSEVDAVIRVSDAAGNVIETHEHKGDFREF